MVVCTFFLRGTCKFGAACRNEHPVNPQPGGGFGNSAWNNASAGTNTGTGGGGTAKTFGLFTVDSIKSDVTQSKDKPFWPLSCYGCAKYEPTMIVGIDQSMEELRVMAVKAKTSGNVNEYISYEASQIAAADGIYTDVRNNVEQFYEQAKQASNVAIATPASTPSAFGTPTATGVSAFGNSAKPSAFGNPSPFGAPADPSVFGAPSASAFGTPVFGAPASTSTFGTSAAGTTPSVFGAPSNTPATAATSAFGNLASAGTTSAFGQPAFGKPAFGQPAFGQSGFGQPATVALVNVPSGNTTAAPGGAMATTSAFGQPAFGQPSLGSSSSVIKPATGAFGAFANAGPSAFGATLAASNNTAAVNVNSSGNATAGGFAGFASSQPTSFASAINNAGAASGSIFGQPAIGNPSSTTPFGGVAPTAATAAPTSAFANTGSVFANNTATGTNSAFGTSQGGSVFGQAQQASPFGAAGASTSAFSAFRTPQPQTGALGDAPAPGPPAAPSSGFPASPHGIKQGPDFEHAKYNYRPDLVPHDSKLPPNYVELLPEATMAAFKALRFEWGKVPEWIPPVEVRTKRVGEALFS